ncbi:hypothetical protein BUY43_01545 [Staphylococcus devriesei]|uniref:Uncharacterized protein n=1 Tax=Staphylococcus devriesei TaxID=586733 RepID=A0A2T4KJB7_9STAP|nr:hypothetical protein [Staphylococcus devriesei]PTE74098.1 hypothetical protein BUY44_02835 [Staphylococcus devriesei]PTF12789.1 hypothetical protein BUY47_11160 [Staphylococcus devriesei]RIL75281.1 hypothetical protein BUY43_01545 [Staphylococcus devriesei]
MQENYIKLTEDRFIEFLKAKDRAEKLEAMLEYSNNQLDNALAYIDDLNLLHNDQSTRLAQLEADRRKLEAMLNV